MLHETLECWRKGDPLSASLAVNLIFPGTDPATSCDARPSKRDLERMQGNTLHTWRKNVCPPRKPHASLLLNPEDSVSPHFTRELGAGPCSGFPVPSTHLGGSVNSVNLLKDPERREGWSLGLETVARGLGQVWCPFGSPQKARWSKLALRFLGSSQERCCKHAVLLLRQEAIFSEPLAPKPQKLLVMH